MKMFDPLHLIIAFIVLLQTSTVVAMPLAPDGPYRSLEDDLARAKQNISVEPKQIEDSVKPDVPHWNWGTPASNQKPSQDEHVAPPKVNPR